MRILVIEDDHKIAGAVKKGLRQEAFAVDVANDFERGFDLALSEEYDVVIIDRLLPGKTDGLEICRELRRRGSEVGVLVLTARDGVRDRVDGLDSGADDYLVKPFAFEELLARVRALLRRPAGKVGEVLRVEDLALDTATSTVRRAGRDIELSRTEFMLLEYLMRNKDMVLSRDKIISHVWEYDADILPNTVEVYVGYLRGKIEKPFKGKKLIHTVRGFGYRMGTGAGP